MTASNDNQPDVSSYRAEVDRLVPFLQAMNIRLKDVTDGRTAFEMEIEERHLRTRGILHGGVAAALLDSAMGFAAHTTAPDKHHVVTVQLNVNYIRPAWRGEKLVASGEVVHSGAQTAVSRGEIRTSENVLVASGSGTFMYLPHPDDGGEIEKIDDASRDDV